MSLPPITSILPVPTSVPEEYASKGRNLQCRICGKWLRRLSVNHLRKHGLQSKAEYKSLISSLTRQTNVQNTPLPEDKVTYIASLILKGQPIPDELITHLSVLQQEVARTLSMSLDVVKMRRVTRLQKLMDGMEHVDQRLFDPTRLQGMTIRDLIFLAQYGSEETRGLAEDLKTTAPPGGPPMGGTNVYGNALFVNGTNPLPSGVPEDPRARSALLSGAAKLLAAQNDNTTINGNPESSHKNGSSKNGSHE